MTREQLKALGESQKEILALYWLWHSRAPAVISAIPEEAEEFKREMAGFIQACLQTGIAELMEESASACYAGKPAAAADRAQRAWEIMMKLLGENSAASSGACSVSGMSRECAGAMQQLLNSMLSRRQGRGGFGSGQGDGGDGLMNGVPMFGPQREKFQQPRRPGKERARVRRRGKAETGPQRTAGIPLPAIRMKKPGGNRKKRRGTAWAVRPCSRCPAFTGMPSGNTLNNTGKTSQNNENDP